MNIFSKLLCGVALLGMATGCSDREPSMNSGKEKQGDVYARLTLSLPSTRSKTTTDGNSDAGFEVGQKGENTVTSVLVVLASNSGFNYNYIASSLADTKGQDSEDADPDVNTPAKPQYTVTFESQEIAEFAGKQVYVFAFCNPQMNLVNKVNALRNGASKSINDLVGNLDEDGAISTDEYFLMSNHKLASISMPAMDVLLRDYNTPSHPFNLGTIDVSRVTARFDFSSTTVKDKEGNTLSANKYPIYDYYTETTDTPKKDDQGNDVTDEDGNIVYETATVEGHNLMGYVTIDAMALMNEALNYYYLPRVSPNGMGTDSELCGSETSTNFVVSPNFAEKVATLTPDFMINNYRDNGIWNPSSSNNPTTMPVSIQPYNYDLFSFENLSDVVDGTVDNDEHWNAEDKKDYRIWKYVTENTIPGGGFDGINNTISYQRLGVTTGIVFRGYIEAVDDSEVKGQMNGTDYIYAYNGQLIGNMATLKAEVAKSPVSSLADAFYAACKANDVNMNEDGTVDLDKFTLTDFQETATTERGEGLKIFKPENGKYYCYYIYRNRHNDNNSSWIMGPMEFAVVRNNVYKIDIESIMDFGHTKYSKDDPDPEDPETPDEPNKAYFRLQVRVLPWVVRINHAVL